MKPLIDGTFGVAENVFKIMKLQTKNNKVSLTTFKKDFLFFFHLPFTTTDSDWTPAFSPCFAKCPSPPPCIVWIGEIVRIMENQKRDFQDSAALHQFYIQS